MRGFEINKFGGLSTALRLSATDIKKPLSAVHLRNFDVQNGTLVTRPTQDYAKPNTYVTAGPGGLFVFRNSAGGYKHIMAAGTKLYSAAPTATSWTEIKSGLTDSQAFEFEVFSIAGVQHLIATNGTDAIQKWNGTDAMAALGGTPPTGKYIKAKSNILFLAGNAANPNRLYFCGSENELSNPEIWGANSYIDVADSDGDIITGLALFHDDLYIFKRRSVYVLSGDSSDAFVLRNLFPTIGAVSQRVVCAAATGLIWTSDNGVHLFDGGGLRDLHYDIQPYFQNVNSISQLYGTFNYDNAYKACAAYYNNKYILSPAGILSTVLMTYDFISEAWTSYCSSSANDFTPRFKPACFVVTRTSTTDTREQVHMLCPKNSGAQMAFCRMNYLGTLDDELVYQEFTSNLIYPEGEESFKQFREMYITGRIYADTSTLMTIYLYNEETSLGTELATLTTSGLNINSSGDYRLNTVRLSLPAAVKGRGIRFCLSIPGGKVSEIHNITFLYDVVGKR